MVNKNNINVIKQVSYLLNMIPVLFNIVELIVHIMQPCFYSSGLNIEICLLNCDI
jgi:hypothetical protein